uniref:Uncharacterized protein n=1 Tax=Suricata suricatta TaxID=37032 RepID=A0A673T5M8_SURSU
MASERQNMLPPTPCWTDQSTPVWTNCHLTPTGRHTVSSRCSSDLGIHHLARYLFKGLPTGPLMDLPAWTTFLLLPLACVGQPLPTLSACLILGHFPLCPGLQSLNVHIKRVSNNNKTKQRTHWGIILFTVNLANLNPFLWSKPRKRQGNSSQAT